ncbi:hypothetical protein D3C80_2008190 [compost metagenome]
MDAIEIISFGITILKIERISKRRYISKGKDLNKTLNRFLKFILPLPSTSFFANA